MYAGYTQADALVVLFQRHELSLDDIIERAVSAIVQNNILELSFSDGSELFFPYLQAA